MAIVSIASKERITNQTGSVIFKCPSCGKADIVRTKHDRAIAARYTCPACEFAGPAE